MPSYAENSHFELFGEGGKQTSIRPTDRMCCMPALYTVFLKPESLDVKRVWFPQEFMSFMKEQICQPESYLADVYINLTSCKTLPVKLYVTHTHIQCSLRHIAAPVLFFNTESLR